MDDELASGVSDDDPDFFQRCFRHFSTIFDYNCGHVDDGAYDIYGDDVMSILH